METERIALNQRERDRLRVLHEVQQGHVTQTEAGRRLQLSDRQVRRLLGRIEKQGDRAVVHGLRGRPSNRKLASRLEHKILAQVGRRYRDFGPTLAAEHLAKEGLRVSRETLRKWMIKAAYWRPRRQRVKKIYVWRERRACFGELVMQDSSPFRWLEERGPACQLITAFFEPPAEAGSPNNCREKERARSSGARSRNWGSIRATELDSIYFLLLRSWISDLHDASHEKEHEQIILFV
jgi:hypothetical protein